MNPICLAGLCGPNTWIQKFFQLNLDNLQEKEEQKDNQAITSTVAPMPRSVIASHNGFNSS